MRTSPMVARHIAVAKMEGRRLAIRSAVYALEQRAKELDAEANKLDTMVERHTFLAYSAASVELRKQAAVIGAM